ncbi:unnamed protein product [Rotaria sordida]|uniref:Uncharacterized protein n=1 Tax=Rotaria sordida TaxID=392033 RepID=A0A818NTU2_9BILA|nr:unnamed protein product [Rotaria sordida]
MNENFDEDIKQQRRRYTSDSNTNYNKNDSTLLVTSFLQYLRTELKTSTNDKTNDYRQYTKQKSSKNTTSSSIKISQSIIMNSQLNNENLFETNEYNEILTLINLLILRVECLSNENKSKKRKRKKDKYPTVTEVDQNLIEYLYYLFKKFINNDINLSNDLKIPIIDKNNFVSICQTLVRDGCFDIPSTTTTIISKSPNQSLSESLSTSDYISNSQAIVHEYYPDTNQIVEEKSLSDDQISSMTSTEKEPWLVVDFEQPIQLEETLRTSEAMCSLPIPITDEQLLITNDIYKSCESGSSHSIYLSPDSSSFDLENMVLEFDEITPQSNISFNEDGSSSNVIDESKTIITNDLSNDDIQSLSITSNTICTRLTNNTSSSIDNNEQMTINNTDKMSRREKKMHERWSTSTKTDKNNHEQLSRKTILGVEFPPIAVLRRKFSSTNQQHKNKIEINSNDKINSNTSMTVKEINTLPTTIKVEQTNPDQTIELPSKDLSLLISTNVDENNDDGQLPVTKIFCLQQEEITMKKKQGPLSLHTETITNIHNDLVNNQQANNENNSVIITNPLDSNSLSSSSSSTLISMFPSSLTSSTNETMSNIDQNEEQYKKIEIEEIPDDEEIILKKPIDSIEPIDCILTDDERKQQKQSSPQPNITPIPKDSSLQFGNVLSCYEKAIANLVDTYDDSPQPANTLSTESSVTTTTTTASQSTADDPIALRAVQRFEERMNAAVAKNNKDETNLRTSKGKSSWSGSLSTSRKSLENLFKNIEQQLSSTPVTINNESITSLSSPQLDSYIRPRKTFDDSDFNYGTTYNSPSITSSTIDKINNDNHKIEEQQQQQQQQQPSTLVENDDKRVIDNQSTNIVDSKDQQEGQQQITSDAIMTSENDLGSEKENLSLVVSSSTDNSIISSSSNTVTGRSSSIEEPAIKPYGFQLEGRRRLNTLEVMRERRQSREYLDKTQLEQQQQQQQQQKLQNEYTPNSEEIQDPIVRRALERYDEKNRKLIQTKSVNYDDIQDPITRRALMRLESNLKKVIPSTTNDTNENWYTENYTLGTLQPTNDRLSRYTNSSQSPTTNNRTKYISVHQRYCTPSSNDTSDLSTTNNFISSGEHDLPVVRAPTQSVYVTSNNQQQQQLQQLQQKQPIHIRQRSRSEDMLTSRDLAIGQTTNLDDIDTSTQLQRNRSSNEIALNEPNFQYPNTFIKTLEPNFTRTTESSVSYATPTQTYSAYSCEYTRPRRNPLITSLSETPAISKNDLKQLPSSSYSQQEQNEIQRPIPYRPTSENQSSSAFAPIRSSSSTTANYYNQSSLPSSSYDSTYTSNNLNQTPYSDDPIVRRAVERFNIQLQNSLLSTSQYQPRTNYSSNHDPWLNTNRSTLMTTSTPSCGTGGGYQSIIGRRRLTRYDDPNNFLDQSNIGDAYSTSVFSNSQNPYLTTNHYMNISDQPPIIPPRLRRTNNYQNEDINDQYRRHSIDEYLSENINNNNNNNNNNNQSLPNDTFIHYAYPATITNTTNFRPINIDYNQQYDSTNQLSQEQDDLHDRTQSISSTNSSDSIKQQQRSGRPTNFPTQINHQQRLPPPTSIRTNLQQNERRTNERIQSNKLSPVDTQSPLGQIPPNNGNLSNDSVFHRLAYTGTKASLSKSSSNSCSNLLNKNSSQLKSCEIDFDDSLNSPTTTSSTTNENNIEQNSSLENKYQRSKSVDSRTRLKFTQVRTMDNDENINSFNDEQDKSIPSSRFTPINIRRDTSTKPQPTNRTNLSYTKQTNGIRTHGSNGNLIDTYNQQQQDIENDENISFNIDNRTRTAISIQHYPTPNNIQTSSSTSSVNSAQSRTKPPVTIPINLDRRDLNTSNTDLNRTVRRSDDNRYVSPNTQRRNIPVSVFAPAKLDNKRPAPAPPTSNFESQNQLSYSSRINDNNSMMKLNENQMNKKISSTNSNVNIPTNIVMNEFNLTTDKQDNNKKMNVFERLFRGNKKKN